MRLCHRLAVLAALAVPATVPAATRAPPMASVAAAENALQRGECGQASILWRDLAASVADAEVAERATEVALACGQYAVAEVSATRWQQLAPAEQAPPLARVRALLQAWRIDEAVAAFKAWLPGGERPADAVRALVADAGEAATWAMVRKVDSPVLARGELPLAIAELALAAGDARAALARAQAARKAGASATLAAALEARAHGVLGEADAALASAGEAMRGKGKEGDRMARAEALQLLGRDADAEAELQHLRNDPQVGVQAARELTRIALEKGDYAVAEERAASLVEEEQAQALAVYALGLIAERRGDDEQAMRDYRLLAGSSYGQQGAHRLALMLWRDGERDAALALLAAPRGAEPAQRIRAVLSIASLLADAGAANEGLARIENEARRAPAHPDIEYQHAVLLARAGKVDAAIALLDSLHKARPGDPAVTNALGYTLADNKRELPRAAQLIGEALAAQPDNAAILDSQGWVLHRRGDDAAAIAPLQRAFRLFRDGEVGSHLAEALAGAGRKAEAREVLKGALAADPDSAALKAVAARLAPGLKAPVPPPRALEPARRTSI